MKSIKSIHQRERKVNKQISRILIFSTIFPTYNNKGKSLNRLKKDLFNKALKISITGTKG